ncbi:unnamed protein product [Linum trigynum]|uniref:Reverse transcriptase zinc-binding domain-containing protein n=1 Tax=Linum trigynum TaxID=586398 RepID=A0AAV2CUI3_9ROSI
MCLPHIDLEGDDPKVVELNDQVRGGWCIQSLQKRFPLEVVRAILAIPFPSMGMEARLIWHDTSDGVFSIKSADHLAVLVDRQVGMWRLVVSWMDRTSWMRLWALKIPPKLKLFLWQIFHRILPMTEALIEKRVQVLPRCPVCWVVSGYMCSLRSVCLG